MEVRVVKAGMCAKEPVLEDGATVQDALTVAGLTVGEKEKVTVNGEDATLKTVLEDGDRIMIIPNHKAGKKSKKSKKNS